jgi:SNF2 family DNA or RNA helicase
MGTVGAMGTGITLNKGSYVMFLDEPWSPQDKMQAEDRAHRIGTQNTVNVLTFVTKDSVDEYIQEIIYKKSALSSYLVDGEIKSNTKLIVNALLGL